MDGRVAACFLVFLALLLPDDVACEANAKLPEYLYTWKFEEDANGFCRFEHYKVSTKHGLEHKEPLRNYVPISSFPSSCYFGHSTMGMNMMETGDRKYVFAACFFIEDQKQRLVCQYLDKKFGFVNFVDVQCNNEKLASSKEGQFFIIGAFFTYKQKNYVEYCVKNNCCRVNRDRSVELIDDRKHNEPFDATFGSKHAFSFNNRFYDSFNGHGFYHQKYGKVVREYSGQNVEPAMYFGKDFDFYYVGHDKVEVPFQFGVNFVGFRYEEEGGRCAVVAERAETKLRQEMKMYCQDNLIGEGYNVEWNMAEQTAYLKGCFVNLHHRNEPRLVCYLFKYGTGQSSAVVDHYFTGDCKQSLIKNKPTNVIVGTGPEKFVAVQTASTLCKVKIAADGKTSEEFVGRAVQGFGFDPYAEKVIQVSADGDIDDDLKFAGLHSIGNHVFARVDDSKLLVMKDDTSEEKDWNYAYVMEEAAALSLSL